jgi:hypothetical protein
MARSSPLLACLAFLAAAAGCEHELNDPARGPTASEDVVEERPRRAPSEPQPFEIRRDQPQLLPFWVRHQRLAALLDLPLEDPVFGPLLDSRLLLGDQDHSAGVAPDLLWSPARMSLWARVLRPVCAHPRMKERHPFLALDLTRAAWGRSATVEEAQGIRDDLDALGLEGAARDEATCIAILSSLEHVSP